MLLQCETFSILFLCEDRIIYRFSDMHQCSFKPKLMICFTPKFLQWFAIFMISFETVSILEPNFKISFTPICQIEVSNSFFCDVGFMQCTKSFDVAPGKNLHTTLDFINFVFINVCIGIQHIAYLWYAISKDYYVFLLRKKYILIGPFTWDS